ncbi:MAG: NAD(P)-dependent oxidoreductase [Bacteroidetes bacterium]|nr:NAD(P)-dependent oxidoreductase [Bacteroidota bacterium]
MTDIYATYERLLAPTPALVDDLARLEGDILVLGAGGKMGPALCCLAREADRRGGGNRKIMAVSRWSGGGLRGRLESRGIETLSADLLDERQLNELPDAANVLYLAGTKFGTTGNEANTWAMNTWLPALVARRYRSSRIVVFSTGNVYPLVAVASGGTTEDVAPAPVGEYAQSCLGRERIFQYFSSVYGTPLLIYRLNYANDTGYGVLLEIARSVFRGEPVDLRMGCVNVIWQNDANEVALRALQHCSSPAKVLNVTGPETLSVRWLAEEFGRLLDKPALLTGEEQPTALLSNAAESFRLFGYPSVPVRTMMQLIARWVCEGGRTLDKPTHFQEREGRY